LNEEKRKQLQEIMQGRYIPALNINSVFFCCFSFNKSSALRGSSPEKNEGNGIAGKRI
jgi:hypothetical protein